MTTADQCAAVIPGEWEECDIFPGEVWLRTGPAERQDVLLVRPSSGSWVAAISMGAGEGRFRFIAAEEREDVAGALTAIRDRAVGVGLVWPW